VYHRDACGSLEITNDNVDRVGERLDYFSDGVLIRLGSDDDRCLWDLRGTPVPNSHRQSWHIVAWTPYFTASFLQPICEELARVLLDEIGIDYANAISIEGEMDSQVADER
jgi:hypothetical protein